ncbi:hypothetical protein EVA_05167 [gut metagenome]|uniref:Uncharacterized protein n=1 Tax=gut metagenome TaxID=749906 RepID=J9H0B3_9ZZZZ
MQKDLTSLWPKNHTGQTLAATPPVSLKISLRGRHANLLPVTNRT